MFYCTFAKFKWLRKMFYYVQLYIIVHGGSCKISFSFLQYFERPLGKEKNKIDAAPYCQSGYPDLIVHPAGRDRSNCLSITVPPPLPSPPPSPPPLINLSSSETPGGVCFLFFFSSPTPPHTFLRPGISCSSSPRNPFTVRPRPLCPT